MFKFGVIVLLLGYSPKAFATDCTACKDTYVAARDTSGATDTQKCAALATYLTCLETSAKTDTGCPLPTADAAAIETGYGDFSCSGEAVFTATCNCQKEFWKTDQSANAAAICSAAKAYITCLKGKTDVACDGSTTVAALATGVETRITNLGSTDCTVTTACQCEINAAKADISDATKCTTYKAQFECLYSLTTAPCASGTTIDALRSAAALSVTSTASCTVTTACQCELDAAKADTSDNAKKCTVLTTLKTCLSAITTTTEAGCTAKTQAALLTDTNTKITEAKCGADHATFATTSLIVSVLVNMFL